MQLDKAFGDLDRGKQRDLVGQIAQVYKQIQTFTLPDSIQGYGGLGFSPTTGAIVTGPTTIPCGGPFACLEDFYSQMFRRQLDESDTSQLLQGWRADGLRDRLERFASEGIAELVRANSRPRQTLVHGDFSELPFVLFYLCCSHSDNPWSAASHHPTYLPTHQPIPAWHKSPILTPARHVQHAV